MSAKLTSTAVMNRRHEAQDSLDDFPTPPWATRALFECVFVRLGLVNLRHVWEPAANRGLMAHVIAEYADRVSASDVHDYGFRPQAEDRIGFSLGSFTGKGPDVAKGPMLEADAIVTNPPYALAEDFYERARKEAPVVALLLRSNWIEGVSRYERIFCEDPPTTVAFFVERVPMVKGRWDPEGSSATSYAWFVWAEGAVAGPPMWIPPGRRKALSRAHDIALARRLGALGDEADAPLFDEGGA